MQKNSSEHIAPKGPPKAVKALLMGFVALSVAAGVYKIANSPCCDADPEETVSAPEAAAAEQPPVSAAAAGSAAPAAKPAAGAKSAAPAPAAARRTAESKRALVYYFYTSARCYSCNTLEKYTREAVEGNFKEPYNGWRVEFRGVNLDDPANRRFVEEYKLTSKAVVAQKFEGDRPLAWKELPDVWRLLGSKELFTGYVAGEIQGLLDAE